MLPKHELEAAREFYFRNGGIESDIGPRVFAKARQSHQ